MGIRETLNERRGIAIAVVAVAVLVCVVVFLRQGKDTPEERAAALQDWYTIDDGKSWFPDDATKFPPFEYQGKTAYRCRVWTCDDGKTPFVSHLERHPAAAKKKLESLTKQEAMETFESRMLEVKLPLTGDQGWVDSKSPRAEAIMAPKCPSGSVEQLRPVMPE